jgi:hypothetical protein
MNLSPGEQAVCRLLAGLPGPLTPEQLTVARRHRVHYLLAGSGISLGSPADLVAGLERELRQAAALDAWSDQDLSGLLDALAADGVDALLFKGAALGHTLYDAPHLRPRVDTDILIRREQLEAADQVLGSQGWSRPPEADFELAAAQRHYTKPGAASGELLLDVHWKIANPRVFADAVSFDELHRRAVPVPALGLHARAPRAVDALWLACVHRVAHHHDEVDLLWLWDIHLLVSRLSAEESGEFVSLAARTAMTRVCARGLDLVSIAFGTPTAALSARLVAAGSGRDEPASRFLGGVMPITSLRADLTTLRGWRERRELLAEHLVPSRAYMRTVYPRWPGSILWLAYLHRVVRGAPKWFRRPRAER